MSKLAKLHRHISRRNLLQFAGVTLAASPFIPVLEAQGQPAQKRAVFVGSHNGLIYDEFFPDQTGTNFDFKRILSPLEPFKDRVTLVGGTGMYPDPGPAHRGHSMVMTNTSPDGNRNSRAISVDQVIANKISSDTPLRSLNLGTITLDRSSMYWRGEGDGIVCEDDPERSFDVVFGNSTGGDIDPAAGARIRDHRMSILDRVNSDLASLRASVSLQDQQILDRHLTSVRELEGSLTTATATSCDPEGLDISGGDIRNIVESNHKLIRVGLACGVSRVGIHMIGRPVGKETYPWLDFNEDHHSVSHNGDGNSTEIKTRAYTYYFEEFAKLLAMLAETPEGGGSMLDNTMMVYSNPISDGNRHSKEDMPFVVVGGNWYFKGGQYSRFEKEGVGRFHVNLLHAFGEDVKSFGQSETGTDPLPDLTV